MSTIATVSGLAQEPIQLDKPDMNRGLNVMQALQNRHSEREFADKPLSHRDLSDLMWAAYGINREDGRHTAASAINKQDIDVYVLMESGSYKYDPANNQLVPVADGDNRALIRGGQEDFPLAPVNIVVVSDISRFGLPDEDACGRLGAIDAGLVSQNIALFCAGNGLVTVPRASMDTDGLRKILKLPWDAMIVINNPVGYPAK